jgi:hypothetical protein
MGVFTGPLNRLTIADIERVVADRLPEDVELEFKRELPSNNVDPWHAYQREVGDRAKNAILAEVIAFANTIGGTLILGIDESTDKPARAVGISPVPKCHELADRFRNICRDRIEPILQGLEIEGVSTDPSGEGVVVFRVGRSRLAPHRDAKTKECYSRHRDRSESMSMREIQDLTLNTERGVAAVKEALTAAQDRFNEFCQAGLKDYAVVVGLQVCAVPTTPLRLGRLFPQHIRPAFEKIKASFGDDAAMVDLQMPTPRATWRPMIGGVWIQGGNEHFLVRSELRENGLIDYELMLGQRPPNDQMSPSVFMAMVCNALLTTESVRTSVGSTSEFALQVLLSNPGSALELGGYGAHFGRPFGTIPAGRHEFPQYVTYAREDWPRIARELEVDLWAAAHVEPLGSEINIRF